MVEQEAVQPQDFAYVSWHLQGSVSPLKMSHCLCWAILGSDEQASVAADWSHAGIAIPFALVSLRKQLEGLQLERGHHR